MSNHHAHTSVSLVNENIDDFYRKFDHHQSKINNDENIIHEETVQCADVCIQEHKNGLFVLCLSPKHFLCQHYQQYRVEKVQFLINPPTTPTLLNVAEAKEENESKDKNSKKVGPKSQPVQPDTNICSIEYHDSNNTTQKMKIKAVVKGKLIEINDRVNSEPTLVQTNPMNFGYLAIVDPNDVIRNPKQRSELTKDWIARKDYYVKNY